MKGSEVIASECFQTVGSFASPSRLLGAKFAPKMLCLAALD